MIDYSTTPQNNIFPTSTPQFQDWGPYAPGGISDFDIVIDYAPNSGQPIPTPTINLKILDVIGNPLYSNYTEFRMKSLARHLGTAGVQWLDPDCLDGTALTYEATSTIAITVNGINYNFSPTFRFLDLLVYNNEYNFIITRTMQGKNAAGVWENISSYNNYVRLKYSGAVVAMVPNFLYHSVIQGFAHDTKQLAIYGQNWKLISHPKFNIAVDTGDVDVVEEPIWPDDVDSPLENRYYGTGNAVFDVTPGAYFDTNNPLEAYTYTFDVLTIPPGGSEYISFVGNIFNQVLINTDEVLVSSPRELYFEGSKGFGNPPPQYIIYTCTNPVFTVTSSNWIITNNVNIVVDGVTRTAIEVKMIPNSNLNVGNYDGVVQITSTIKGVSKSEVTKVKYKLSDFVDLPYNKQNKAFTLDKKFVQFATQNTDTYMQFDIDAKVFDFFSNTSTIITIPQKIALFKGKAELNVGKTIHKIMKRFATLNNSELQYKVAQVYFNCKEIKYADNSIVREVRSDEISFVAGLSYDDKDMTILDINLKPNRATKDSYAFLNLLLNSPNSALQVYLNGALFETQNVPFSIDTLVTKKIEFSDFEKGDVIGYKLVSLEQSRTTTPGATDTTMTKVFKMFDTGDFSNQIIFENEYLLKSTVDCLGSYKIQTEIEFQSQTLFQQLVEVLEVLDSTKAVKLTINTGWLLKSDIDTIESLMRSRRIWLEQGEKSIDLRPAGKSIVNDDSERERIEFTLEFTINKKYNEETYSL